MSKIVKTVRLYLAIWLAKAARVVIRMARREGTNMPGRVALKICPDVIALVAKPPRILAVTGTNGKTTTTNMISDILSNCGKRVLSNRAGSNTNAGIAAVLISGVSIFNRSRFDVAVLEIDERSARLVFPGVKPELMAITNLFRDSIMRNAHPQFIADYLTRYIPKGTKLVLNADDLISSSVSPDNERVYYGIERLPGDVTECVNRLNDMRICPKCAGTLRYEYLRYHHIGRVKCADCGFESPAYDYAGTCVDTENMTVTVRDRGETGVYRLPSDTIFNIYNVVTAVAMLREFGMAGEEIRRGLESVRIVGSRLTRETVNGVTVVNQMAKGLNPMACSRAFDYISHLQGEKEIILYMNCYTDEHHWSENICWMYDCDFEFLNDPSIHIIVTGPRGKDFLLRVKLAGVPEERLTYVRDEFEAPEKLYLRPGSTVFLLYGADDSMQYAFKAREKVIGLLKGKEAAE